MKYRSLLFPVFIILIWLIISHFSLVKPILLPSPIQVFVKLFNLLLYDSLMIDIASTLWRTFLGYLLAVIIGIPIGVTMGYTKSVYDTLEFTVDFFRSLPASAILPLFLLIFGLGDISKIALACFTSIFIIIYNSMYGVKNSEKTRIMVGRTLDSTKSQVFSKIVLPDAMPQIAVGLRLSLSISLVLVIVSEMLVGTQYGLGNRIYMSHLAFRTGEMYATIIVAGIIGYLLNKGFVLIEKKSIHWAGRM